jgi:hypothetical protein
MIEIQQHSNCYLKSATGKCMDLQCKQGDHTSSVIVTDDRVLQTKGTVINDKEHSSK